MRFKAFSDKELYILEDALCCEYAGYYLIYEIRRERERRAELKGEHMNRAVVEKAHIENRIKRDFAIKELEKLKAEFEEDRYILLNQTTAIKVIDNRITQLKGE